MGWKQPPYTKAAEIEYRFTFVDDGDDPHAAADIHRYILPGTKTS